MPKGRKKSTARHPLPTAQIWVRTVEGGHRVRIPRDLALVVSWLPENGGSVDCVARIAAASGLQIVTKKWFDTQFEALNRYLATTPPAPEEAGAHWLPLVRSMATHWPCALSYGSGRYTLTLPEEARLLGVAPSAHKVAVLFAVGNVLEIWKRDDWVAHVRGAARDEPSVFEEAMAAIRDRID